MIDIFLKRRSRRFYKNNEVENEKEKKLIQALLLAPTSRNLHPCRFIIVKDKFKIEQLSKAKEHGSSFLKDAPLAVVILANPDVSDIWVEDASIAATFLQLEAETLGLGSCWIQIRKRPHNDAELSEDYVKGVLEIPPHFRVCNIVAVGYSDEEREASKLEELPYDDVYLNKFDKGFFEN